MDVAVILHTAVGAVELFCVDSVKVIEGAASVKVSLSQPQVVTCGLTGTSLGDVVETIGIVNDIADTERLLIWALLQELSISAESILTHTALTRSLTCSAGERAEVRHVGHHTGVNELRAGSVVVLTDKWSWCSGATCDVHWSCSGGGGSTESTRYGTCFFGHIVQRTI